MDRAGLSPDEGATGAVGSASHRLASLIERGQRRFAALLHTYVPDGGGSLEQYARYLTMQFHLTRDVQTYFVAAAGHRDLARRRALRKFLVEFANEEELHYLVAANDLSALGLEVGPAPIDVVLWHSYFRGVVHERPFVRLGAACVLENISGGPAKGEVRRAMWAPFINRANSKFLVLHQHEILPHGDQILEALDRADLEERHLADLEFGASVAVVLYLRMAEWAVDPGALASIADTTTALDAVDRDRVGRIDIRDNQTVSIS
jgi:hypothetical protein